jgi:hypothetical protein
MKSLTVVVPLLILLGGCSYSVSMIHSDRSSASSDNLDENQTDNPNISPVVNAQPIPKA